MNIRVVTDSTCDLPKAVVDRYGITVIPIYINVGSKGYLDGVEMTREEFYTRLPHFETQPTTATPSPEIFRQVYERLVSEGADQILSIHISSSLSATSDVARTAVKLFTAVPVKVIDGHQLSLGTGFLVETAARMAQEGHTLAEIIEALEDQVKRTYVFASLDTVEYLRRSGRMNMVLASLVSLLHIKPLLKMYNGHPTSERVPTHAGAMRRLVALLNACAPLERVALVHTHSAEKAEMLRQKANFLIPEENVISMDITPVIGAHIGPGAVGFAVISKSRKEAL
jgi:DegV family protein with EDD domain